MKVVFALGNPGSDYTGTRHNTGFMAIDAFTAEHNASFAEKSKFQAYVAELSIAGDKILLVKPTTFYNEVGVSARALIDFYKLSPARDMLVVHDDLALPFGTIRVRGKGSDAGNNGIKSLNTHIGEEYARLRVGIAVEGRTSDDASFVLGRFNSDELASLQKDIIPKLKELIHSFLQGTLEDSSHKTTEASRFNNN